MIRIAFGKKFGNFAKVILLAIVFATGVSAAVLLLLMCWDFFASPNSQSVSEIFRSAWWRAGEVSILIWLAAGTTFVHITADREFAEELRSKEEELLKAEEQAQQQGSFAEFLKARLDVVAQRAALLMIKVEGRANLLYRVGTIFVLISVIAPGVAGWVYISSDPLPSRTVRALAGLRDSDGKFPNGVDISTARDWHILLSGGSFGFLFLAAAGALFAQHRRQMDTAFLLAADVDYFKRMLAAVEIAERSDRDRPTGAIAETGGMVLAELLKRQLSGLRRCK